MLVVLSFARFLRSGRCRSAQMLMNNAKCSILAALENLRCSSEGRVDLHFAAVAENLLCVEAVRVGGNGDVRAHNLDIY